MTDWTSGYVTDIGYLNHFYREMTPTILSFAALSRNNRTLDSSAPISYCELGCGQGFSANLLAAANPQIDFHAMDFNPAYVVGAQALATAVGTPNLHFYDHSFAEFLDQPGLPAFDVVALHGVYSWVSQENRRVIVEIIRKKLKPGGLVYISYNTLPGWAAALPLRRLFVDLAATESGPIIPRIERALAFAQRLVDTNPAYTRANPGIKERLEKISGRDRTYLAHEFFNRDWTPFYHTDVMAELAAAKLTYIGSANLLDQIDTVNLSAEQQALLGEVADPTRRETLRDYMVNQEFRRDVFIKGAVFLSLNEIKERWSDTRFVLSIPRIDMPLKVLGARGWVNLREDVYVPILDALAAGPRTIRQLAADPKIGGLGWAQIQQAMTILVGSGHLQPCLDAKNDGKRSQRTKAFNATILERAKVSADLGFLASPVSGGAIPIDRVNQLFLLARQNKIVDPAVFVWEVLRESIR